MLAENISQADLALGITCSGNIEASPEDVADINVCDTGDVRLLTRSAQLRTHVSGSGRITQPPLEAADGKK